MLGVLLLIYTVRATFPKVHVLIPHNGTIASKVCNDALLRACYLIYYKKFNL
jgi:hypothetical protein